MKKQIPTMILAIACIVLLIAYSNSSKTIDQLREEIAQLHAEDRPAISEQSDDASLVEHTGTVVHLAEAAVADEDIKEDAQNGRRMMKSIATMMENPTMNKVMEASQRGAIGALYTDLIEYLNLNREETKYFMDLLMYRQMKQVDLAMKMMSGELSDEEKQALTAEIAVASDTVKEEMEKFLNNPEDYAEWEFYEETIGERMMLSQMDQDLAESDAALSDESYRELLGIMHDSRKNFDFTSDLHDQENMDMSAQRFSEENLRSFADDIQRLNDIISREAARLLTPEQLEIFINALKTTADMQMAQLEMVKQMFGGGNEGVEDK